MFPLDVNHDLVIDKCPKRGLYMQAKQPIPKGKRLYVESPFLWYVRPEQESRVCRYCSAPLTTAGGCADCGAVPNLTFTEYFDIILRNAITKSDNVILDLLRQLQVRKKFAQGESDEALLANVIFSNSYDLIDEARQPIVTAMYPRIATINHSCKPNATFKNLYSLDRDLYSIRNIQEGEEIFVNYFDHPEPWELPSEQRRKLFHKIYSIVCKCQLCERCCHCKIEKENLRRCAKCNNACYCSKECQVADWSRHKLLCADNVIPFKKVDPVKTF